MTTSEPASGGGWEQPGLELTWSAEGSPASPCPSPVRAWPKPTNGGSGQRPGPSFATYDPDSRSWKTSQASLLGGWETYSQTWPRSGMTRSGIAYPLQPSAPLTDVTGSSWLPTPAAVSYGSNQGGAAGRVGPVWPTPTVKGNYNRAGLSAKSGDGLATAVARAQTWPTPTASLGTKGGRITPRKSREGGTLIEAVSARMWPTPAARDWKDRGDFTIRERSEGQSLPMATGGPLNPTWVEWLMGLPAGWTDLGPSATRSSRRLPNTSAAS
jgi:hypothetical protein